MASTLIKFLVLLAAFAMPLTSAANDAPPTGKTYRILHVMSFDSPFRWSDAQLDGFKDGLGKDLPAEYKVVQMDIKRNSTPAAKEKIAAEVATIITDWKPNLVYVSDDDAVQYIAAKYANQALPFVFSGMNKTPATHGIEGASNITGVLEQEHFVESVKLLQAINPKLRRLVVIGDEGGQWPPVIERIRAGMQRLPGTTLVSIDIVRSFDEYKAKLAGYPKYADAVVQLGVFNFKDEAGGNVPYQQVHRWTVENTTLPEISFWIDRIHHGVMAAMTISGREQGLAAGRQARAILRNGAKPSSLPIRPTVTGVPAINLARAKALGMTPKASTLLSAEVVTRYEWDAPEK